MNLAPYAIHPEKSQGRYYLEQEDLLRTPFQRDRDRIIHATAFRRLKHKTQVFVATASDHYRTRLTHSLEVAQIARTLARALALNEDLAETLALAHDLGHPPFGHAGEEALARALNSPFGDGQGFDHNAHSLRIVWALEGRYPEFLGLNLTFESLEGLVKHNGPLANPHPVMSEVDRVFALDLGLFPSLEAQLAALADDIAYCCHDLDDGVRSGLLGRATVATFPFITSMLAPIQEKYTALSPEQETFLLVRALMQHLVHDLVDETRRRLAAYRPRSVADIYNHKASMASFSEGVWDNLKALKKLMFSHLYRHPVVRAATEQASQCLEALTLCLLQKPDNMPPDWQNKAVSWGVPDAVRVYVAGMTDRYALEQHRLFV